MNDGKIQISLLPWKNSFQGRTDGRIPHEWVSVYPVLKAFANEDGIAWPSLQTIGILTGMDRDKAVKDAIARMIARGWLEEVRERQPKQRSKGLAYKLTETDRKSFAMGKDFVRKGAWAELTPSARVVWVVLKANSWYGGHYLTPDYPTDNSEGYINDFDDRTATLPTSKVIGVNDFTFIPIGQYNLLSFYRIATRSREMSRKTFGNAVNTLVDKKIIFPVDEGIILPHEPGVQAPAVMERLARAQAVKSTIAPGTRRTLNRLVARSKQVTGNQAAIQVENSRCIWQFQGNLR